MKHHLVLATVALMALTPMASAETMYCLAPKGETVNVRQTASPHGGVIGWAMQNDAIEITEEKNGYSYAPSYPCEWGEGWIRSEWLSPYPYEEVSCKVTVRSNGRVAVRKLPQGERIKWVSNGITLRAKGKTGNYYETDIGWICGDYLEVSE